MGEILKASGCSYDNGERNVTECQFVFIWVGDSTKRKIISEHILTFCSPQLSKLQFSWPALTTSPLSTIFTRSVSVNYLLVVNYFLSCSLRDCNHFAKSAFDTRCHQNSVNIYCLRSAPSVSVVDLQLRTDCFCCVLGNRIVTIWTYCTSWVIVVDRKHSC